MFICFTNSKVVPAAALSLVLSLPAVVSADTITVCWDGSGDYLTIQDGIDAAVDGDEVVVCDGVYTGEGNKNLDFGGKAITVRSENGPENCIIDCENDGRGFHFHSGETGASVLDGLTITNGEAHLGGAISCEGSCPTIRGCTIGHNTAWDFGGGVFCGEYSHPTVTACRIWHNMACDAGGAICCWQGSNPKVTECTIARNTTNGHGAGVHCENSSPAITNCAVTGNLGDSGGAVYCDDSSSPVIANCMVMRNRARYWGGAFHCQGDSSPTIRNCTIGYNAGASWGGAIRCRSAAAQITNCILWYDSAQHGPEIALTDSAALSVSYSDVQGGEAGVYVEDGCELAWGPGNVDADPLFVDPDGPDDDPNTWEDNDYRLSAGSPCIDAGCNMGVPPDVADLDGDGDTDEITPLDLDGEARFFDDADTEDTGGGCPPIVDMGAYELGDVGPQPCPGDLDCDRTVGHLDLAILLSAWHSSDEGDLNCDGLTDHADLGVLLGNWGNICP